MATTTHQQASRFETMRRRVNHAYNFFGDTDGVDYCDGLSAAEIAAIDKDNRDVLSVFPELRRMGY